MYFTDYIARLDFEIVRLKPCSRDVAGVSDAVLYASAGGGKA